MSKNGLTPPPGGYGSAIRKALRANSAALALRDKGDADKGVVIIATEVGNVLASERTLAELAAGALYHGKPAAAKRAARSWAQSVERRCHLCET